MERQEVGLPLGQGVGESQGNKPGVKESPLQLYNKIDQEGALYICIGFVNIVVEVSI